MSIIGLIGCEQDQEERVIDQNTPNDAPVTVEQTEPPVATSEISEDSPLYNLPLNAVLNPTMDGFRLDLGDTYNPFVQLTLHVDSKDHVINVVRRTDERADWTLYRQDLVVVYPDTGEVQVYPMTNAYITDSYSVDSLGYACRFTDDDHIVFPASTGDEPGKTSSFQIVRMNVRTGEREVLFDQQPEVVQPDFYNRGWIAYSGDGSRFAVNSYQGGNLWVYDLQKKSAKKLDEKFPNSWPLSAVFPAPDGNLFWYDAAEELRLYDLDGNQLASFPRTDGYTQYPPIEWSIDGEYSIYYDTFEKSDDAVVSLDDGMMKIAPQGIIVFDRKGNKIRQVKVADGSKRHLEITGWFPNNGEAVVHEYDLDRKPGAVPEKINSTYKMLDVRTGVMTVLKNVPIGDLKRPFAMKVPSFPYPAETELVIVDPDSKQFWASGHPAMLFNHLESKYMYWVAPDYSASKSIIYRYSLEDRELRKSTMDRILRDIAIQGDWLVDTDLSVINYTELDKLF